MNFLLKSHDSLVWQKFRIFFTIYTTTAGKAQPNRRNMTKEEKIMKKFLSLLLVLSMAFTLAACGSKEEAPAQGGDAPAQEESSGETVKIGLYGTITGTNALAGEMLEKGARIAVDEINAAGGVKGKPLELVVYDDKSSPEGAVKAVTRMVDVDKVVAMVGSNSSPNIIAGADITEDAGVIQVGAGTSPSYTNAGYQYIFRGTANADLPNKAFVDAMSTMGATKVAILSIATEYGTSGVASVKELLPETMEIVCEEQYQATDTDFTGQIAKVLNSGADAVVLYGTTSDMALVIRQLRSNGYDGYIYGPEGLGVPDIINVAGADADGVIFGSGAVIPAAVEDAANDVEEAFLTTFVDTYGQLPVSDVVYRGYDAATLIGLALNNAEDISDPDSIREAFLNITDFEGIAGTYDFSDGSGDGLDTARTYIVHEGKNVLFSDWQAANG